MAMDKSAADAYVYAKASGMLARSFVGPRAIQLFNVHSLKELWSLLFTKDAPVVPEKLLARALESEAQRTFISQYLSLISNYAKPDELLVALLHQYDYNNIKQVGAALCFEEKDTPELVSIEPYNLISYDKWPDIALMTADSPLAWYDTIPTIKEQQQRDYKIDCQFIREVWSAVRKTDSSCKDVVMQLIGDEFRMENILWALRLRVYYKMGRDEIINHLAFVTDSRDETDPVAGEAMKILDWEVDSYDAWKKWKYASYLNPHEEGVVWSIDPRWVYASSRKTYVDRARKLFHQFPFTVCPLVCWYIIKQNELDTIRTASEGLRMSVDPVQAMQFAGVTGEKNG